MPLVGTDPEGAVRHSLLWLERWQRDASRSDADRLALLRVALCHHQGSSTRPADEVLERARHLLATDLAANMHLEALARNVGISRAALVRRFRARYGSSLMAYRRQCRLDQAIDLLRAGERTAAEVATAVSPPRHLSNVLLRERGQRPTAYVAESRQKPANDQEDDAFSPACPCLIASSPWPSSSWW